MADKYKTIGFLILAASLLTAACGVLPVTGSSGNQPDAGSSNEGTEPQATKYLFNMSAEVDGLVDDMAYDQLKSEWVGEFSVDSSDLINGDGMLTYDALIFAVDEDLCGYAWTDKGTAAFRMSGRIHQEGNELSFPVKIFLLQVERHSLSEPEATCSDPIPSFKNIPNIYMDLHRDALINTVLTHLHENVGNQIRLEQALQTESGTVSYNIRVSLPLAPLD